MRVKAMARREQIPVRGIFLLVRPGGPIRWERRWGILAYSAG